MDAAVDCFVKFLAVFLKIQDEPFFAVVGTSKVKYLEEIKKAAWTGIAEILVQAAFFIP